MTCESCGRLLYYDPARDAPATQAGPDRRTGPQGKHRGADREGPVNRLDTAPKRICIDMDEVMADAVAEHLQRYNRDFGEHICVGDLQGKWLWGHRLQRPSRGARRLPAFRRLFSPYWRLCPMRKGSSRRSPRNTRYSSRRPRWKSQPPSTPNSRGWQSIFRFIPPSHIVFCGDKSILEADYLIDDKPAAAATLPRRRNPLRVRRITSRSPASAVYPAGLRWRRCFFPRKGLPGRQGRQG